MQLWIGLDRREHDAFAVAFRSAKHYASEPLSIHAMSLDHVRKLGLYRRPTETRNGRLFDCISQAPMSTEFAISRFLTPYFAGSKGWALFTDCDVMFRRDPFELFALADPRFAIQVVKHSHMPADAAMVAAVDVGKPVADGVKMDGQVQQWYARKNWSSVILWNLEHPSNRKLTVDMVNTRTGRDLHAFCWLDDSEIGALPATWNHLVGAQPRNADASLVHFTEGVPSMPGYDGCEHADEWWTWARYGHLTPTEQAHIGSGEPWR